ncbi:MAG: ABC transporter permease subunit [Bacteroidetes bacterium]|nr:ABC transporter permease subunit [Bacteroidota bacterium]MBP6426232.1 ABC transporter permease subunit [Bacteroidia bacterium]MBK8365009.1 ABC transporter permease subunit [Bacteroidota bacterium]MBK9414371.1 ABC transporter permease subunit [Bacteroidota bacterium]MBL0030928.1 ABC transporter permease subunit [Bacteroidota bacterium]
MNKVFKYFVIDILRNKTVIFYTLFLFIVTFTLFSFEENTAKGLLSLLNIILFIVPLISIIFSTIYVYNCSEFIELLICQPLKRKYIWLSLFTGLAFSLCLSFLIGCGIPVLIYEPTSTGLILVITGCLLSVIFVSIALLATVTTRDKAKGIGKSILLWLYFALIFDGLVLFLLFQFAEYPLEKMMMAISGLNPIDLSRIIVLLRLDVSALMGYTGAVFKDFFGTTLGFGVALLALSLWAIVPLLISTKKFRTKDL